MERPAPRRWFRFTLRTLFAAITALCLWVGWEVNWIHRRRAALEELRPKALLLSPLSAERAKKSGDRLMITWEHAREIPVWRRLLGDESIGWIYFDATAGDEDLRLTRELFPEAD